VPAGIEVSVRGKIVDLAGNLTTATDSISTTNESPAPKVFDTGSVPLLPPEEMDGPIASRTPKFVSQDKRGLPQLKPLTLHGGHSFSPVSDGSQKSNKPSSDDHDQESPAQDDGGPRAVASKKFTIDYQVDDVGPSGIGAVEFFVTQDGGSNWFRYGNDEDKQSPFHLEVPSEGRYGFDVRVRSGAGLADDPPAQGQEPAIVIVVDQTAPQVKFFPPEQGRGQNFGRVLFRWSVDDANPARTSVSLAYAASKEGPWEPITPWMEDRGGFLWEISEGLPERVYVRLNARDRAGNVTRVTADDPLIIDLSRPKATILNVGPAK